MQKTHSLLGHIMPLLHKRIFFTLNVVAIILAILPYVWTRLFGYQISDMAVMFVCAFIWPICFTLALWTQRWRWRPCILILVTAPLACGPAVLALLVITLWSVHGFAP